MQSAFDFPVMGPRSTCRLTLEVGSDVEVLIRNIAALSLMGRTVESIVREVQSPSMFMPGRTGTRRQMLAKTRHGARWEQAEIDELSLLTVGEGVAGATAAEVQRFAEKHARTPTAVLCQLIRMGRLSREMLHELGELESPPFPIPVNRLLEISQASDVQLLP